MLSLTTLASGSSGNCLLVSHGSTHLLVDAGISARRITNHLKTLGLSPSDLSGILITHEHGDHISGLATLHKQYALPLYTSFGTAQQLCRRLPQLADVLHPQKADSAFALGDFEINIFSTLHDTPESVGYSLFDGRRRAAIVTDLGVVTESVTRGVGPCDLLVAETNHSRTMVMEGPYPYYLKDRILGNRGHLSNEAGAELIGWAASHGTRSVILAHLSSENNTPTLAYNTVASTLATLGLSLQDVALSVAPRGEMGPCHQLD